MFWEKYAIEKKDLLIPASILIGAILVSASILGSSGKIKWLESKPTQGEGSAQIGNKEIVKITERKGAQSIGSGKVEIVEFSDFQCQYCQRFFNDAYKEIKAKYIETGKVKFVYRHFPLPFHQNAQKAAEAAECAGRQGKFFEYHDILFTKGRGDGTGLEVQNLKQYAKDMGLNTTDFNSCLDEGKTADIVKKDLADGKSAGVSGTPTAFVNGQKIVGAVPFATFAQIIDEAMK